MGARNVGEAPFGGMLDTALGLATGVPVVLLHRRLVALAAMHIPAQSLTPTPTRPAQNAEPGTMSTNQANRPPASPSPSRTN